MILETVMDYIHNYFVKKVHKGDFKIVNGNLDVDFLQQGQYFKIIGSVFNDAVHQFPTEDLTDEQFCGEVWAMAVPPTFIALCGEIEDWISRYGDASLSPFTSESFGGYSYTKASGTNSNGEAIPGATWQSVFRSKLIHWRKII